MLLPGACGIRSADSERDLSWKKTLNVFNQEMVGQAFESLLGFWTVLDECKSRKCNLDPQRISEVLGEEG